MGVATYLEGSVNNALATYVVTYSDAVVTVMTPIALTAVTGYVMWTGFHVMRGEAKDSVSTLIWRWFRVALIAGLALSGPEYRSIVTEGLVGIQGAFATAFGGAGTVGGTIDLMITPFYQLAAMMMSDGTVGVVPQFGFLIAATIAAVAGILMGFVAMGIYLVAKVSLALLFAIGPAFIFCAMFPATQRYTESWLSSVLGTVFTNVLIMAVLTFLASIIGTACANVVAGYSTTQVLTDAVGLLLLSASSAYLLLNIQSLGAGLAGTLSLGNPGGEAASLAAGAVRALVRRMRGSGSSQSNQG
jgi:type IV secretion system protein VirB6